MTGRGDGFLSRWSRRKVAAQGPAPDPMPDPMPATAPDGVADTPSEPDRDLRSVDGAADDPPVDDPVDDAYVAALPPVDSITASTDLRPFLRNGVPKALRNAALRRMWMADPVIRDHLDVARDYFWDWNAPGGVPGGGGTLAADAVARMVRDVIGVPAADPPSESAPEDASADPVPDQPTAPDTPAAAPPKADIGTVAGVPVPHDPVPHDHPVRQDRQRAAAPAQSLPSGTAAATQTRRHGGATPT